MLHIAHDILCIIDSEDASNGQGGRCIRRMPGRCARRAMRAARTAGQRCAGEAHLARRLRAEEAPAVESEPVRGGAPGAERAPRETTGARIRRITHLRAPLQTHQSLHAWLPAGRHRARQPVARLLPAGAPRAAVNYAAGFPRAPPYTASHPAASSLHARHVTRPAPAA